jgi:voltage-gated potassium channel Kch
VELEATAQRHPVLKRVLGSVPGVRWLVGAFVAVAIGAAIVARLIAPQDFPTIGIAFWWSIQTVTTVGYGDVAPKTTEGRIVAAVLMIAGIASISLVTATISAGFVRRWQERRSDSTERHVLDALARIEGRLDDLERRLVADDAGSREPA